MNASDHDLLLEKFEELSYKYDAVCMALGCAWNNKEPDTETINRLVMCYDDIPTLEVLKNNKNIEIKGESKNVK